LEDCQRLRRQAAGLNDVARELRALRRRRAAERIVDVDAVGAQIAIPRSRRRHRQELRAADLAAQTLVVAEDEQLGPLNLAAERSTELIAVGVGNVLAGERIRLRLRKWIALLEAIVEMEFVDRAVQHVRS